LAKRVAVARVPEDAVGIVTYIDLLFELAQSLTVPTDVMSELKRVRQPAAIERAMLDALGGRVMIAVVENLSRIFDRLGVPGQRDFRSFVETSGMVVLLASAPLLFDAIGSRNEPWFGSFAIEHLGELSLDEGLELMRRLAVQDEDAAFIDFLDGPVGPPRVAALRHLAGGSPRLWMILAGCATVDLLDELVPAVEELLEKLVPYYQERLWDLPGNESKLVKELGIGPPSATVAELAASCGLEERTAAAALGRLQDSGWVRSEKLPGADQRKTWYRLREPLLRHHFQYRSTDGEPLRLIVDVLRLWFDPHERRAHLAMVRPTSLAERHLAATFLLDPPHRTDQSFATRDVDSLLAAAREWVNGVDALGSREAGMLVEAVVVAIRNSVSEAKRVLKERKAPKSVRTRAETVLARFPGVAEDLGVEDRLGAALDATAGACAGTSDFAVMELVAACWNGIKDISRAVDRLTALADAHERDRLGLTILYERAVWLMEADRDDEALAAMEEAARLRSELLGRVHPDTVVSRGDLAGLLGMVGRHDEAVEMLLALLAEQVEEEGAAAEATLETARQLALEVSDSGHHDLAANAYRAVLDCLEAAGLGGTDETFRLLDEFATHACAAGRHADALTALETVFVHRGHWGVREEIARELGHCERHDDAASVLRELLADRGVLTGDYGINNEDSIRLRRALGWALVSAGRPDEGVNELSRATAEAAEVYGADDEETLETKTEWAIALSRHNRYDEAFAVVREVVEGRTRLFGEDHVVVLASRDMLATFLARRDAHEAVVMFEELAADCERALGAADAVTLDVNWGLALAYLESNRPADAEHVSRTMLETLVRTFGTADRRVLVLRYVHARSVRELGHHKEAADALVGLIEDAVQVLGETDVTVDAARGQLASAFLALGRIRDAVQVAVAGFNAAAKNGPVEMTSGGVAASLTEMLLRELQDGAPLPPSEELGAFAVTPTHELLRQMEAARDGSPEALAALPEELRALVQDTTSGGHS
jgi:tetratricopeptide (TPR) repeat protein